MLLKDLVYIVTMKIKILFILTIKDLSNIALHGMYYTNSCRPLSLCSLWIQHHIILHTMWSFLHAFYCLMSFIYIYVHACNSWSRFWLPACFQSYDLHTCSLHINHLNYYSVHILLQLNVLASIQKAHLAHSLPLLLVVNNVNIYNKKY